METNIVIGTKDVSTPTNNWDSLSSSTWIYMILVEMGTENSHFGPKSGLDKVLCTNIHNLGHFWGPKYPFSVPTCERVSTWPKIGVRDLVDFPT